jgi:hypothetical protein
LKTFQRQKAQKTRFFQTEEKWSIF